MRFFDGHCDTVLRCYLKGEHLADSTGHWNLDKISSFTEAAQFFACFGEPEDMPGRALWNVFQEEVDLLRREIAQNRDRIVLCTTAGEMETAWKNGEVAAFLSVEGAELLDCSIDKLRIAHQMGVRAVNITWNHSNVLSGSNVEEPNRGLSRQGQEFVREMNRLGVLIDVSHLSDSGFWDVVEITNAPIIASHSNSRFCHFHTRNLTDEQFTAIMKNRGVAGLNFCDKFLAERPTLDDAVAHIEHFLSLGGEENVAIGGDWDGCDLCPGVEQITDLGLLCERLLRRNYKESLVRAIFRDNLMRVVREVCTI